MRRFPRYPVREGQPVKRRGAWWVGRDLKRGQKELEKKSNRAREPTGLGH